MYRRYLFVCCVLTASQVAGQNLKYALLGKTACFNTDIKTPPDEILWKRNENKLVEFNGQTQEVFGSFKDRISMDWHTADLNISEARFEDSGLYGLETYTERVLQRAQYNLKVIDKVPKPTISCEMMKGNGSDDSGRKATLMCSAEQSPSLLTFTWSPSINGQLGPKLIIPLGDEHDNQEYSCTVRNPLTKESAIFIANKCYSDENSSIPTIVSICVGCVALILIIVLILLCLKVYFKHFKSEKTHDVEKQKPREITEDPSEVGNGDLETTGLLDRAPTLPSNQRLSHLVQTNNGSQNVPFMNELRRSVYNRPGAENKNQDLRISSSPAPEKPPRSPDFSAEDKDQTDGETVKVILDHDPVDPGIVNNAVSKQEVGNGDLETTGLLDRAPTLPSNQRLSHLVQNNKGSQNAPFINELRRSVYNRPGAENKNQDLSTLSSPAPGKPPRSQDLSAEDNDQTDGGTAEEILELDPADSGIVNNAESKQDLKLDKTVLSPLAPEKPPRQDLAELGDEDKTREAVEEALPEKSTKKRALKPPLVAKKSDAVLNYKTQVDENNPPEETKELSDQNLGKKDKVTKSETPLSPSLLPETTVLKSPVPELSDPETLVPMSPVPKSPIYKPPVPLPRSRSSQAFPKNEHKEDSSSDQVAGKPEAQNGKESGLLGSGEESERPTIRSESTGKVAPHEQQPPVTETNQGEETLQENNKQGPEENPKPNGEGDQEERDSHVNTFKEPQSLESSKPDNNKADSSPEPPDAAEAVPDHKNQDNTRHSSHSETGPEKEDKSETAEGKNEDQS